MVGPAAIFLAIDLFKSPSLASVMQRHPLPDGVLDLIKIAGGSEDALADAETSTGKERPFLKRAAVFYLRQVLWAHGADSYRALGVTASAGQAEIAEHFRWLMKWLHPDRGDSELAKIHAAKVLDAWETLKSDQRRIEYDRMREAKGAGRPRSRRGDTPPLQFASAGARPGPRTPSRPTGPRVMMLSLAVAFLLVATAFLMPLWL
jgi:hypothetical protein